MATVYTRRCDICGRKAVRGESYTIGAAGRKQYIACKRCSKPLASFMKKNGISKTVHPRAVGSQKTQKLKTRRR